MTKRTVLASAAVAAALTAVLGPIAAGHDDDHGRSKRRLKATLSGFNEYPSTLSTTGHGSFEAVLSKDETKIEWGRSRCLESGESDPCRVGCGRCGSAADVCDLWELKT